jgi:hypothetical protein
MARSQPWPFEDDDRPSGSVQPLSQADLQAILAHLDDDRDELLAGTGVDRPVVAVRPRASVGRPGGSAQARWRRVRAAEWTAWTRTVPCGWPPPGPRGVKFQNPLTDGLAATTAHGSAPWHQYLGTSDGRASGTMTARTAAYADD